ncbi:MAG: hypothetical protein Q9190_005915 [Brigantiaea leucoxantha]
MSEFLKPLRPDERDGLLGLDTEIIDKLFTAHNERCSKIGFTDELNLAYMRGQPSNANTFKDICDPRQYINAIRAVFDARLFWPGAPGWVGHNEDTELPSWPMTEFRVFLEQVYELVYNIPPPNDYDDEGPNRQYYEAFNKAGGFPTFQCIQAAKTLWIMLAYEKSDPSSICKENRSNTSIRNTLIGHTPHMKRTRFWTMDPPEVAINCFNEMSSSRDENWNLSWRYPIQLARDLHDTLYASFLNDATDLRFPPQFTIRTLSNPKNRRLLLKLPMTARADEREYLFHWRRLAFAKAMDKAIKGWGEEIGAREDVEDAHEADSDDEDGSDTDDNDDSDNDDDDPEVLAQRWSDEFVQNMEKEFSDLFDYYFDKAVRQKAIDPRHVDKALNKRPFLLHSRPVAKPHEKKYTPLRNKHGMGAINEMPLVSTPGIDFDRDAYEAALEKDNHVMGLWGKVAFDVRVTGRTLCIGGPADLIRNRAPYLYKEKKGWKYRPKRK